jgi:hypothetical protein
MTRGRSAGHDPSGIFGPGPGVSTVAAAKPDDSPIGKHRDGFSVPESCRAHRAQRRMVGSRRGDLRWRWQMVAHRGFYRILDESDITPVELGRQ